MDSTKNKPHIYKTSSDEIKSCNNSSNKMEIDTENSKDKTVKTSPTKKRKYKYHLVGEFKNIRPPTFDGESNTRVE